MTTSTVLNLIKIKMLTILILASFLTKLVISLKSGVLITFQSHYFIKRIIWRVKIQNYWKRENHNMPLTKQKWILCHLPSLHLWRVKHKFTLSPASKYFRPLKKGLIMTIGLSVQQTVFQSARNFTQLKFNLITGTLWIFLFQDLNIFLGTLTID